MIWCCGHRHPYGFRRVWLNKDNNSEINTANPVFGEELVNGKNAAIFHVNFIKMSEKYFNTFILSNLDTEHLPPTCSLSIEQERFIKKYLEEGDKIIKKDKEGFSHPLDFYDEILKENFLSEDTINTIHNSIKLLPEHIKSDIIAIYGVDKENRKCLDMTF